MTFQEELDSYWNQEKEWSILYVGKSKRTGQLDYIHYDGTPANARQEALIKSLPGDFKTIEAYVSAYRTVSQRIEYLLDLTQRGKIWEDELDDCFPSFVSVDFIFPYGKQGDVDYYIASTFGEITKLTELNYRAIIPTSERDQIAKMMTSYDVRFQLMKKIRDRTEISAFMNKYNLFHQLRQLADEYILIGGPQYHPLRNKARDVAGNYMDEIRRQRHMIYSYLAANKITSGRWKSEQMAYAIVKNLYPDAQYQFKADWLGHQSLDIYIPSKRIGIEYQGQQHYDSIELFGGEEGLKHRKELDQRKLEKCNQNNISLVYWKYDEPITEEHLKSLLKEVV